MILDIKQKSNFVVHFDNPKRSLIEIRGFSTITHVQGQLSSARLLEQGHFMKLQLFSFLKRSTLFTHQRFFFLFKYNSFHQQ